jgi:hypothetical protein
MLGSKRRRTSGSSIADQLRTKVGHAEAEDLLKRIRPVKEDYADQITYQKVAVRGKSVVQERRVRSGHDEGGRAPEMSKRKPKGKSKVQQVRVRSGNVAGKPVSATRKFGPNLKKRSKSARGSKPMAEAAVETTEKAKASTRSLEIITRSIPDLIRIGEAAPTSAISLTQKDRQLINRRLKAGINQEFPESSAVAAGSPIDLVVGFDFGTSSTKIVVRAPYLNDGMGHAVPVASRFLQAEENPYLWRTLLWLDRKGQFGLIPEANATPVTGLKAGLLSTERNSTIYGSAGAKATPYEAGVAYLALMYRMTRGWLFTTQQKIYAKGPLNWQSNVGFPAAKFDKLSSSYRQLARAGWWLSCRSEDVTIQSVRRAIEEASPWNKNSENNDGSASITAADIVPEVAAEVVGFARSMRRNDGLYTMIDIGAATLDVSTFRLFRTGIVSDCYSFLLADVSMLGVKARDVWSEVARSNEIFEQYATTMIRKAIWCTRQFRDPNNAIWEENGRLPIFVCGGGSNDSKYRSIVASLDGWISHHTNNGGTLSQVIERPEQLVLDQDDCDFGRLAVAWGLSHPGIDIGELRTPGEIEDVERRRVRDIGSRFISKDMI